MGVLAVGVPPPVLERLREFFVQHCEPPRSTIAAELQQESTSQSTAARALWTQEVDCMKLLDRCPELGRGLFDDTLDLLSTLRAESAALCREAAQAVRPEDISIRLTHLPTLSPSLPTLPARKGQLVQVCGSIVRMSTKRVVPYAYRLMCHRCHAVVEQHTQPYDRATLPRRACERPECNKEALQVVGQLWMDYAECRLQQRSNQSGRLPRSVLVTLDDELSTKCGVGQFVEVIGVLHPTWRHLYPLSRPAIEPAVWAINVLPMEAYRGAAIMAGSGAAAAAANQQRRRGQRPGERPKFNPETFFASFLKNRRRRGVALANSTAPQLSGLYAPRMSLLLSALNGASTAGKTSMHVRSTIHCLFVGDPSTGKSQLLRFAASVAPRSTSTTGMGSTSAGLTVAATKEQGEWVLEPGALVLSDGGTCVIDELRTVSPADRASLHEAMEQQTISVAKGGLVTKLRTACSVLSACNPPPLKRNGRPEIGVGGPLLSRFDFIFLLWDTPQPDADARVADHVLSCSVASRHPSPLLTTEDLARYLWWLRAQYAQVDGPLLTDTAADLLGRYYEIQRQRGASPSLEDAVPVTVRLLESLVRIAQAHAKLHLQSVCDLEDAAMAIFLMERSAHSLKMPLRVLGPDIYSSTRELDDVFLSDTEECLAMQEAVLEAVVDVVRKYGEPPPPPMDRADCENTNDGSYGSDSLVRDGEAPPSAFGAESGASVYDWTSITVPKEDFRGSSSNHPGISSTSQYERCQLAVQLPRTNGTQSSGDEVADCAYDLLAFRRQQQQQHLAQRGLNSTLAAGLGAAPGPVIPSRPPRQGGREESTHPGASSPFKSQEELVRESALALQQEVRRSFAVPSARATYAPEAVSQWERSHTLSGVAAANTARWLGDRQSSPRADQPTPLSEAPMSLTLVSGPPPVQQTAPLETQRSLQHPVWSVDGGELIADPADPQEDPASPLPVSQQGTLSGKKRVRSAEEIMRSLRFQW